MGNRKETESLTIKLHYYLYTLTKSDNFTHYYGCFKEAFWKAIVYYQSINPEPKPDPATWKTQIFKKIHFSQS